MSRATLIILLPTKVARLFWVGVTIFFFKMMYQSPKLERWGEQRLRLWTDDHELILEKAELGQSRNLIKNFETIEGKWHIIMAHKALSLIHI